jgi:GNAT superfamily N-acetyltransferase
VDQAETSLNHAERSLETARAAQNTAMRARQEVNQEYQAATEMLNRTRQGQSFADEGRVHLSRGEKHEAEAQMDVSRGRREVEDKIEILREVNRPTLGGSSGGFGGGAGSSGISGRSGGIGSGSGTRDAVRFVDGQGRSITIKQQGAADSPSLFAYDPARGSAPDSTDSIVGRANLSYESYSGKLKLSYIEVEDPYKGSGIGGKLRTQVEQLGRQYGASEIYGDIKNDSARAFWQGQAKYGWRIIDDGTAYGSVIFRP